MSAASEGFTQSIKDAENLLLHFDTLNKIPPPEENEVLKRAGLVMAMTAWETYVEDRVREATVARLGAVDDKAIVKLVLDRLGDELSKLHNPSQTDALLMSHAKVWAIEAKWTEPRYETVARRMRRTESDGANPRKTVEGWLRYLQPFSTRALHVDDFADVVYQIIHRAASACWVATERNLLPELVYLHFHPSPLASTAATSQYVSDLQHLRSLLGPEGGLGITVAEMTLAPTAGFLEIRGLDKRRSESAEEVSAALQRGPLFGFKAPELSVNRLLRKVGSPAQEPGFCLTRKPRYGIA